MTYWLFGSLVIVCALAIRLVPLWRSRNRGCDAYYYLLCVEEFKKHRKLPIVLPPYFKLDIQEQRYPPGFIIFLSLFPTRWLKKNYWLITPAVDAVIAYLAYDTAVWVSGDVSIGLVAGTIYALTYPALSETTNLNSRPFGSLLLAGLMLSVFQYASTMLFLWLVVSLVFGYLVCMTHKMSAQLMYFLLPMLSLVLWSPVYILVLVGILFVSWLLSFGMYTNILKGQLDILKFWNRNWYNLGAHEVYTSPVYGDESRQDSGRVFQKGFRGFLTNIKYMGANVFIVLMIFPILRYTGFGLFWGNQSLALLDRQLLWWAILTYLLAAVTIFIPRLRFYGEGYKYLRMAALPVAVLGARSFGYVDWHDLALGICLLSALALIVWRNKQSLRSMVNPVVDADFAKVLDYLKSSDSVKTVLSLPTHLADAVVYYARKPVVWGTHSDNFKEAESFFPVMRQPMEWFIAKYGVTHILLWNGYVLAHEVGLKDGSEVLRSGLYAVYGVSKEGQRC